MPTFHSFPADQNQCSKTKNSVKSSRFFSLLIQL